MKLCGYNGIFKAERDTKIGVVPIGYADGIIRKNTGRHVYIKDNKHIEETAKYLETIPYEILCEIGVRVPRRSTEKVKYN